MFDPELSVSEKVREITAGSTYDDSRDLGLKNGGSAHQTRFVRAVDYAIAKICCAKSFAGVVQSMQLGMSEDGFLRRFPATISRDHFALASDDSADWQFTDLLGCMCLLNGKLHILLISVHAASLQSTRSLFGFGSNCLRIVLRKIRRHVERTFLEVVPAVPAAQ
jgi:hypothetical protein